MMDRDTDYPITRVRLTPDDAVGINTSLPAAMHDLEDYVLEWPRSFSTSKPPRTIQPCDNRTFPAELLEGLRMIVGHPDVMALGLKERFVQAAIFKYGVKRLREMPTITDYIAQMRRMRYEHSQRTTMGIRDAMSYSYVRLEFYRKSSRVNLWADEDDAEIFTELHYNIPLLKRQLGELVVIAAFEGSKWILPQDKDGLKNWCGEELGHFEDWLHRVFQFRIDELTLHLP